MTRSFHKSKEVPHHCYTNAAGAVKSNPLKVKKEGHGSKGSWGSTADEIREGREILDHGDLPPLNSPDREKSMRKLSFSSVSTDASGSANNFNGAAAPANGTDKILEEDVDAEESVTTTEGSVSEKM